MARDDTLLEWVCLRANVDLHGQSCITDGLAPVATDWLQCQFPKFVQADSVSHNRLFYNPCRILLRTFFRSSNGCSSCLEYTFLFKFCGSWDGLSNERSLGVPALDSWELSPMSVLAAGGLKGRVPKTNRGDPVVSPASS